MTCCGCSGARASCDGLHHLHYYYRTGGVPRQCDQSVRQEFVALRSGRHVKMMKKYSIARVGEVEQGARTLQHMDTSVIAYMDTCKRKILNENTLCTEHALNRICAQILAARPVSLLLAAFVNSLGSMILTLIAGCDYGTLRQCAQSSKSCTHAYASASDSSDNLHYSNVRCGTPSSEVISPLAPASRRSSRIAERPGGLP